MKLFATVPAKLPLILLFLLNLLFSAFTLEKGPFNGHQSSQHFVVESQKDSSLFDGRLLC